MCPHTLYLMFSDVEDLKFGVKEARTMRMKGHIDGDAKIDAGLAVPEHVLSA